MTCVQMVTDPEGINIDYDILTTPTNLQIGCNAIETLEE